MLNRLSLLPIVLLALAAAPAPQLPEIPRNPIARKDGLLLSDDFNRTEFGKNWHPVVPTYTLENGALKGTQTRLVDKPAEDGKPAVKAHAAVFGTNTPTKDSIVELRFKFAGATMLSVEFDDRNYKGSHYGHICRVRITPRDVTLMDERDGSMRNDIRDMANDPSKREERARLLKGRSVTFPHKLDTEKWHTLTLETVGDCMRATIDGKPVAFLKSSGIAHPTKSKIEFGCAGQHGFFDDIKVFNAAPLK